MAFQPVPGVVECTINYLVRSVPVANVLHVAWEPAITPTEIAVQEAATAVMLGVVDVVMPNLGGNAQFINVTARSLEEIGGFAAEASTGSPVNGEMPGETLPNNVALCYTKRTARAGRSRRGRLYLCGLVESQVNGNFLADGVAATLGGIWDDVRGGIEAAGMIMVVVSRYTNLAPRPTGIYTEVTSVDLTDTRVDSMRRRLP